MPGGMLCAEAHAGIQVRAIPENRMKVMRRIGGPPLGRALAARTTILRERRDEAPHVNQRTTLRPPPVLPFPSTGSVHFLEDMLENRSSRRGLRDRRTFWHRGQCVDRHDPCDRNDHRKEELEHKVPFHLFPPRCSDPHTLLLQRYRRDRCDAHHIPSL